MISKLIFVRHGETIDNVRRVAQGWSDSELSERGRHQVSQLAQRLQHVAATSIFCSTLPRAIATAEVISQKLGLPIQLMEDLREMHCGEWEGSSFVAVRETNPEFYRKWAGDPLVPCPGGESFHDVLMRMRRAVDTISRMPDLAGKVPVIVSHGTAIRVTATGLLEIPLINARNFTQDNAALNIFEWRSDRWVLKTWNDTTHCGIEDSAH
jgi:phosphoserine phosphatase